MKGSELRKWRKANGYKNQAALQEELKLGSRGTIGAWENSLDELPRLVSLALEALERHPELREVSGTRASASEYKSVRKRAPSRDE